MLDLQLGANRATSAVSFIKETDENNFEKDVLVASLQVPVIAYFWSVQSPLCQSLGAVIEKAVTAAAGSLRLVKVNIDRNMVLAQALQIETVPTVYVFFQGKPVDGFAGNKSAADTEAFIAKIIKAYGAPDTAADAKAMSSEEIKKLIGTADEFFQESKYDEAMADYSAVLEADSENMDALGGIGWCLLSQGDQDSVKEMLVNLSALQLKNPRLKGLQFMLTEAENSRALPAFEETAAKKDPQSCFDSARHYLAAGKFEQAVDTLIAIISKNREWEDRKAHKFLLEVFEALGEFHPLTSSGRRKLSAVLFS